MVAEVNEVPDEVVTDTSTEQEEGKHNFDLVIKQALTFLQRPREASYSRLGRTDW